VLAVYRLAYLTTTDSGPARVFKRFRLAVYAYYGGDSWQYEGATCVFCQSVWYALPAAIAVLFGLHLIWVQLILLTLGLAGAVLVLHWLVLTMIRRVES
jgi:hypothetical protein